MGRHQSGGKRALEQLDCDERRIRADERRLGREVDAELGVDEDRLETR
jgi:hypothetical protein